MTSGEQSDWFDADPPTHPLPVLSGSASAGPPVLARPAPAVPPAAARLTAWPPPGLLDGDGWDDDGRDGDGRAHDRSRSGGGRADRASPPTLGGALRGLRSLWAPHTSRARSAPLAVRRSYRWWLTAMAFGVAALIVSIVAAWQYRERTGVSLAGGTGPGAVLTELGGLLLASIVVARLRAGDDWARTALALVGGLIALLSALTAASNISFVSSTPAYFRSAEALLRLVQAAAAGLGIWYMFQPAAARHFDPRRGA